MLESGCTSTLKRGYGDAGAAHDAAAFALRPKLNLWRSALNKLNLWQHTTPLASLCGHVKPVADFVWQDAHVLNRKDNKSDDCSWVTYHSITP